jgi:hypothetical protein
VHSGLFTLALPRNRFVLSRSRSPILQLVVQSRANLEWAIVVSAYVNGDKLYQTLTLFDLILVRTLRAVLTSVEQPKIRTILHPPLLSDDSIRSDQRQYRKIFVPFSIMSKISVRSMMSSQVFRSVADRAKQILNFEEIQDLMKVQFEYVIETNMPQLLQNAIIHAFGL